MRMEKKCEIVRKVNRLFVVLLLEKLNLAFHLFFNEIKRKKIILCFKLLVMPGDIEEEVEDIKSPKAWEL